MFDASQYAFFGNDVVEEVELGGLEEEDEILSFTGMGEDFSFDKEEVNLTLFLLASLFVRKQRNSTEKKLFIRFIFWVYLVA